MRVIVRGRFDQLTAHAADLLRSSLDEHDVSRSEFTTEGTLTYDSRLDFFSIRYEVRLGTGAGDSVAVDHAMGEAQLFLLTMGFSYRSLTSSLTDVSAVWERQGPTATLSRIG